jgi:hypothetical protein
LKFRSHKRTLVTHRQQAKDEDRDLQILPEEAVLIAVAGVETLLLIDTMDVLPRPTGPTSMDGLFEFVMIIGQ